MGQDQNQYGPRVTNFKGLHHLDSKHVDMKASSVFMTVLCVLCSKS